LNWQRAVRSRQNVLQIVFRTAAPTGLPEPALQLASPIVGGGARAKAPGRRSNHRRYLPDQGIVPAIAAGEDSVRLVSNRRTELSVVASVGIVPENSDNPRRKRHVRIARRNVVRIRIVAGDVSAKALFAIPGEPESEPANVVRSGRRAAAPIGGASADEPIHPGFANEAPNAAQIVEASGISTARVAPVGSRTGTGPAIDARARVSKGAVIHSEATRYELAHRSFASAAPTVLSRVVDSAVTAAVVPRVRKCRRAVAVEVEVEAVASADHAEAATDREAAEEARAAEGVGPASSSQFQIC
jgi:hypothetical protein